MAHDFDRARSFAVKPRRDALPARRLNFASSTLPPHVTSFVAQVALLALVATTAFGTLGAIAFVGSAALLAALTPQTSARNLMRFFPLLIFPLVAMTSTLWSEAPERTFRAGIQLFITCATAILICQNLNARTLLRTLFFGFSILCLLLLQGAPQALQNDTPLYSALLGSKNQVGFAAHMLLALSLAVAFDREQPGSVRITTFPAIIMGLLILILSQSAGAKTSLAITLVTFPAFIVFGKVKLTFRIVLLIAVLLAAGIAMIFLPDLQAAWSDFRVTVLKKDATLTGRTYLWDVAARLNAERPWLGRGYNAFWRHGNIDAEGLWRWGGIASRSGFNFHNAYIETQVELGWLGAGLFIAICGSIAAVSALKQILSPSTSSAFFLSFLIVLYLRGYAESGLVAPFSLLTTLWIAAAAYGAGGSDSPIRRNVSVGAGRASRLDGAFRSARDLTSSGDRQKVAPIRTETGKTS
ncbi:O-antigen ligase family protein [bacterium]|nr:MAG: O-antigen ligase family protein [bacterium]